MTCAVLRYSSAMLTGVGAGGGVGVLTEAIVFTQ
jgi:hypothetical protein